MSCLLGILYDWVPGLCGVPDEPHAANVSCNEAEGSGVGVLKEPFVSASGLYRVNINAVAKSQVASNLCFQIVLDDCMEVSWETVLVDRKLYIEIPTGILPDGSKERLAHPILVHCFTCYMYIIIMLERRHVL